MNNANPRRLRRRLGLCRQVPRFILFAGSLGAMTLAFGELTHAQTSQATSQTAARSTTRIARTSLIRSQFPSLSAPAPLPPVDTPEDRPMPADTEPSEIERAEDRPSPDGPLPSHSPNILSERFDAEPLPVDNVAASNAELTIDDLLGMASVNHPAICKAMAKVSAARGNYVQVGLPPNPVVGYSGQQIGSNGLAEQDGVFIEQEFVRGGKLRLNREVAAREVMRAERELWIVQQRVMTDVRQAYYHVAVAQRQLDLTEQLQRIAADARRSADALYNAKEVSKADVLQAELEVENTAILLQNARNRQQAAWRSLANVAAQPTLAPQRVVDNLNDGLSDDEWETTLSRLLHESPELAAASAEVERARWALERARAEPRPNVTVQGLINTRDNGIGGKADGGLTVGLPVPLWNRNQGGIAQAQCELAAALREIERVRLGLQNRLAPVFERYANARNQVDRYRNRILPAARESLELTQRSYQAGELGFLSLLTSQRTFFQTSLSYVEAIRELRLAEAEIDGLLLSDSLTSP